MKKRLKKKRDRRTIELCRRLKWHGSNRSAWSCKARIYTNGFKIAGLNDLPNINKYLLRIVRKCIADSFPIEEYTLSEISFENCFGKTLYFINSPSETESRSERIARDLREIGFWAANNQYMATAVSRRGVEEIAYDYCWEAVSTGSNGR